MPQLISRANTPSYSQPSSPSSVALAVAVIVIICGAGAVLGWVAHGERGRFSDPYTNLAHHVLLPAEEPQVGTITNPLALAKEQPFFAGAEAGDKVFLYPSAQKAIIYSPRRDVVVNMGPLVLDPALIATLRAAQNKQ